MNQSNAAIAVPMKKKKKKKNCQFNENFFMKIMIMTSGVHT